MAEINHCGSCAGCCRNVTFSVTREEKERDFPNTIEVQNRADLESTSQVSGVWSYSYYMHNSSLAMSELVVNGTCPKYDKGCTIYDRRPQKCKDFRRGGSKCQDIRTGLGLPAMKNIEFSEDNDTIYSNEI